MAFYGFSITKEDIENELRRRGLYPQKVEVVVSSVLASEGMPKMAPRGGAVVDPDTWDRIVSTLEAQGLAKEEIERELRRREYFRNPYALEYQGKRYKYLQSEDPIYHAIAKAWIEARRKEREGPTSPEAPAPPSPPEPSPPGPERPKKGIGVGLLVVGVIAALMLARG